MILAMLSLPEIIVFVVLSALLFGLLFEAGRHYERRSRTNRGKGDPSKGKGTHAE